MAYLIETVSTKRNYPRFFSFNTTKILIDTCFSLPEMGNKTLICPDPSQYPSHPAVNQCWFSDEGNTGEFRIFDQLLNSRNAFSVQVVKR